MKLLNRSEFQNLNSDRRLTIRIFDSCDYVDSLRAMREFTEQRIANPELSDEIWLLQHYPVFTRGTSCDQQTLVATDIPVVDTDRGGQITYHGPGQIVIYPLLKLRDFDLGVKTMVTLLEQVMIDTVQDFDVRAERQEGAPGIYVNGDKLGALGLRVSRGRSFHGLSLNIDMDLKPFDMIDPCGYVGLKATQLKDLVHQSVFNDEQKSSLFDLACQHCLANMTQALKLVSVNS